jgi:AraC-like DNA-binding protein/mannose-6-phosphate isomerase-like protein (cupin superfamily)
VQEDAMFDIHKASQNLEELEFRFQFDGMMIDIQWFRVMNNCGDWNIARHMHSFFEFHFIRSGSCRVVLDTGEFAASSEEFYVNAPGVYHEQSVLDEDNLVEYCLCCDITRDKEMTSETEKIYKILNETPCEIFKDTLGIITLFEEALSEAYYKRIGFYNKIKNIASLILLNSMQIMGGSQASDYNVPLKSNSGDYRFLQINKFIDDNVNSMVTVKQVADFIHLSEKQVLRITEKNMGISTKELIIRKKITRATDLIKNTSLSISEISDTLGFTSEYYFSQFFRKFSGCAPSLLRKKI